jgi:ATP-dependent protease HslVU (ClpYQ) peptidase subunit
VSAEGFIIMPDDSLVTFGPVASWAEKGMYSGMNAWGSGADFARGAMSAGATAEEAVQHAMHWDTSTGGEIIVLRRA